jgi:transporter family-2 protein
VSVLVSLACGMIALLVWERSFAGLRAAAHEPAWLWIGGVMSVFIIFAVTIGPPRIGVTATVAVVIAGNLVSAAIIDRFGLFGVERVGLGWPRVLGFGGNGRGGIPRVPSRPRRRRAGAVRARARLG